MTDSEKLDLILSEIQELKKRTTNIETSVADIKLTLENEIRVNIRRVAEGHFGFSRNLHENEMLSIRVNILESELRRIKERLDHIA